VVADVQRARSTDVDVPPGALVRRVEGLPVGDAQVATMDVPDRAHGGDRLQHLLAVDDHIDVEDRLGREPWHRRRPHVLDSCRRQRGECLSQVCRDQLELRRPRRRVRDDVDGHRAMLAV
jgi:hypothetical protein